MKGKRPAKNDLADLLQQLVGEIQVLRQAVDAIWEEVQWANRNADDLLAGHLGRFRLQSMPADPAASDWASRLNAITPDALAASEISPAARPTASVAGIPAGPPVQRQLFWPWL